MFTLVASGKGMSYVHEFKDTVQLEQKLDAWNTQMVVLTCMQTYTHTYT